MASLQGELVIFPDDDRWYPPWFLSRGIELMSSSKADILDWPGRQRGRTRHQRQIFQGSSEHQPQQCLDLRDRMDDALQEIRTLAVDGFDETIGVGAATPWQACEAQDIICGRWPAARSARFDPSFYGHHKELIFRRSQRQGLRSRSRLRASHP
jgi:hypothetical protein